MLGLIVTLSITRIEMEYSVFVPSVVMLSVIMLNVVMLSASLMNVVILSV